MEDINLWKEKFEICVYSKKLLNKLQYLNTIVNKTIDIEEVKKAIYYARKYHMSQLRQSGEPYYSHPIEVACMLVDYAIQDKKLYLKTDLFVVAILHDTIEDTQLKFEKIQTIFNHKIAIQVLALTKIKGDSHQNSSADIIKSLWIQKKYDLLFIKLLDRLHNLQTLHVKSTDKIQKIAHETFDVFIVLAIASTARSLEKDIYTLACQALSLEMIKDDVLQSNEHRIYLDVIYNSDIDQYLSQVFQNVISPIKS